MDENTVFSGYRIEDRSYLSFIKREIHNQISGGGFASMRAGEIDIIVSELTSNLIKHAGTGEIIYRLSGEGDEMRFEVFCIDNGPGTNDIKRMMTDGVSSANTLGHGLGSIKRLSDFFQIYSQEGWGTIAYSCVAKQAPAIPLKRRRMNIKAVQLCIPGERLCGDGYWIHESDYETRIFVGDGIGHGPNAHEAVQSAIEAFKKYESSEPVDILRHIHSQVKKTRGLVATVAILNHAQRSWKICGVGNIATRLYHGLESKNYMSYNGIIGLNIPNTMKSFEIPADQYSGIIMCSDGIKSRWDLHKYPSLLKYDPAIIAAAIFKDYARRNDDMTVLVGKINPY